MVHYSKYHGFSLWYRATVDAAVLPAVTQSVVVSTTLPLRVLQCLYALYAADTHDTAHTPVANP